MIQPLACSEHNILSARTLAGAASVTANFDCLGADYATLVCSFKSAINTNAVGPTLSLLHSDDTVVTNFATIVANVTQTITNASLRKYFVDLRGKKRYLRLTITAGTATNDDLTLSVNGQQWRKKLQPSATADLVGSTNDAVTIVN